MQGAGTGELSSLPLQVVIYFSGWYLVLLYPSLLAALIYKGKVAPTPAAQPGMRRISQIVIGIAAQGSLVLQH